jgi:cold shock CspA family protein
MVFGQSRRESCIANWRGIVSAENENTYLGTIQGFNVQGSWGVILIPDGNQIWFNGDRLSVSGDRLQVGEEVEFDAFFHEAQQVWEAVNLRRVAISQTDQGISPVGDSSDDTAFSESAPSALAPVTSVDPVSADPSAVPTDVASVAGNSVHDELYTGTVKHFDRDKGWGFVTRDDGTEVFVHRRNIEGVGFRYLVSGEPVEFKIQFNERQGKSEAVAVRPPAHRKRGVVKNWDNAKGFGRIQPDDGTSDVFLHHSEILGRTRGGRTSAEEGESVEFEIEDRPKGPAAVRVKRLDSRLPLFRFANMGVEEEWLDALAAKAEPENWSYLHAPNTVSRPILRSYLAYTFARVREESDDADDRDKKIRFGSDGVKNYACFNTGLVTPNQESIYALFVEQNAARDGCDWRLQSFCAKSDRPMLGKFDQLPEMANYFDDPSELIYDRKCELVLDVDHIIDERLDRFPRVVHEADDPRAMARNLLHSAQDRAVQRVNRNYKTAIPHYYQGSIQLLLPLCLGSASKADLALTVTRHGDQYRGGTVLTLDMAYNNARLLTKPDTEWLQP